MDNNQLISIVIPTFNRAIELKRAINSVMAQTYQEFEILVIDDCSKEDIKSVVTSFNDSRIKLFKLNEKGNANIARNFGVRKANGEYIAFLDSDDEYLSFHLERRVEKIKKWKCDGIYGSAKIILEKEKETKITRQINKYETPLNFLLSDGFAPTPSLFITKDSATKVQWNNFLERHQDYDFLMRYMKYFEMKADYKPTVVIHWEETRKVNFQSSFNFISKHLLSINPYIYVKYLIFMRNYTFKKEETKTWSKVYERELYRYIKYIDLQTFLSLFEKKNFFKIQFLKLKFVIKILFWKSSLKVKKNEDKATKKLKENHQKEIKKITKKNFSIISSNCWGGSVYEDLGLQYQTPTIGLFFYAPCYIEFLKNMSTLLNMELKFVERSKYKEANLYRNQNYAYPIGILNDKVEIHFLHYNSKEEAKKKWERRKKRVDMDNLYISITDKDLCTYEIMLEFDKLPFKKKVFFTAKKHPNITSAVMLLAYKGKDETGDIYNQRYLVTQSFNLKKWLEK